MSFRSEPKTFCLNEEEVIWARPGDDFNFYADFDEDMSGAAFVLEFEPYEWPYRPTGYNPNVPIDVSSGFVISDTDFVVVNGRVSLTIDADTVSSWKNQRFYIKLKVTKDGRTWIAAQRTMTVAEGD